MTVLAAVGISFFCVLGAPSGWGISLSPESEEHFSVLKHSFVDGLY